MSEIFSAEAPVKMLRQWPNGWIDQDEGTDVGLCLGHIVLNGDSAPQRGTAPNFRPMSVVAKCLDGLRCHLVWR